MVRALLVRGMLAGLLAGSLAFAFGFVFGEPQLDRAITFEAHALQHAGAGHTHQPSSAEPEPELVSRAVQSTAGLLTGVAVYGCAFGGIFALVFAYAHGRLGRFGPRATAAILAASAFVLLVLVPQLEYPANPPSVGDPDSIGVRTSLYFGTILLSLTVAGAAFWLGRRLSPRLGTWNAAVAGGAVYILAMTIASFVLPAVDEVPPEFSAALLWRFRLASLGTQAVLWAALGLIFGAAAERPSLGLARRPLRMGLTG